MTTVDVLPLFMFFLFPSFILLFPLRWISSGIMAQSVGAILIQVHIFHKALVSAHL